MTETKTMNITNNKVNLSFAVISDVHIKDDKTIDEDKFKKALQTIVQQDINTILIAGDLTNSGSSNQYDKFNEICKENLKSNTKLLTVMGNHDYWNNLSPQDSQKRFVEKMNTKINSHEIINGFHFIQVSTEAAPTPGVFSGKTIEWVKHQLQLSRNDDPYKPIFFTVHQHISDTVYGSDSWGNPSFKDILKDFPQAIVFSGHSHYPISDERSINQCDFTSIGTASLSYIEMEDGVPQNEFQFSQGLIVNVYEDNTVQIKRRDFHNDEWIKKDWIIEKPIDKNNFIYTSDRINHRDRPYFTNDSIINVDNITENSSTITFSKGNHDDFVHSYKIEVINKTTNILEQTLKVISDFYLGIRKMKPTLTKEIYGLNSGTNYEIKIKAIESFGLESQSILTTIFKTIPDEEQNLDKPKPDVFEYDFSTGDLNDKSGFGNTAILIGDSKLVYDNDIKLKVAEFNGKNNNYIKVPFNKEQISKIIDKFTLESVFKVNEIKNQAIIENCQNSGIGFELSDSGKLEIWAYIGDSYKRIGAAIKSNEYCHVLATYNGKKLEFYLNGEKSAELIVSGKVKHPDDLFFAIGGDPDSYGCTVVLNGRISLCRLYSNYVNSIQVAKLFNDVTYISKPKADIFNYNFNNGELIDISPYNNNAIIKGDVKFIDDETLNIKVAKFNGKNNNFIEIPITEEQRTKITDTFSIEVVFKINELRNQAIIENCQETGVGLEVSTEGFLELWAHIGDGYKRIGSKIDINEYYHVVATYTGEFLILYLNGKKVDELNIKGKVNHPNMFFAIGGDPDSSGCTLVLDGNVALVRLYSNPIYNSQVNKLFSDFTNRIMQ